MGKKHNNNQWNYNQASGNDNFFGKNKIWRETSTFFRNNRRSFYRCRRTTNVFIKWIVFGSLIGVLFIMVMGIPFTLVIILCALAYLLFCC